MATSGEVKTPSGTIKGPVSKDKFAFEEWMLAAASGIEAVVLNNNPIQGTLISNDDLLAQFYKTCRDNPTEHIFSVVRANELANIKNQMGN